MTTNDKARKLATHAAKAIIRLRRQGEHNAARRIEAEALREVARIALPAER